LEQGIEIDRIQIPAHQPEARMVEEWRHVRLLERRIVVVGEEVDPHHLVAAREQGFGQMGADEAGDPGHERAFTHNLSSR
jgi:hypothetical protein